MYTFLTGSLVQWEYFKTTSLVYLYIQYNTSGMVADVISEMLYFSSRFSHCLFSSGSYCLPVYVKKDPQFWVSYVLLCADMLTSIIKSELYKLLCK